MRRSSPTRDRRLVARAWGAVFGVWALVLTGAFAKWLGPPGLWQVARLRALLAERVARAAQVEGEILALENEWKRITTSAYAQEREVRRALGYAARDEIVFSFDESRPPRN